MKIGFYIKWNKGSLQSKVNVIGDELYAEQMCKNLVKIPEINHAELYAYNNPPPPDKLDVMVYLNDTTPQSGWVKKHVLYMQNAYNEVSDEALKKFQSIGYDGYAFISNKLFEFHKNNGY